MKKLYIALAATVFAATFGVSAATFTTAGTGSEYSFAALSKIDGSNVTSPSAGVYVVSADIKISEGDSFVLDKGATVKLANDVRIDFVGKSTFDGGENRTLITRASEDDAPKGFFLDYEGSTPLSLVNVDFEYAQISNYGASGFDMYNCTFKLTNGKLSSIGAVNLAPSGAKFTIDNCTFDGCTNPAIGSGANVLCGMNITNCIFNDCNSDNTNKPMVNVTVAGDNEVVIEKCKFVGTGRNRVGGIAVSNLLSAVGTNKVKIIGCDIRECRYGLTGTGSMTLEIRDNTLINNNHETNAMQGGSGISLAGYNYGLNAVVSGNHIENSLWGITLIQCSEVSLGKVGDPNSPGNNTFKDNGNGGQPYDLYNNGANTVYAQNNTWSVPQQTAEEIEKVIFHKNDDARLGEVIFMPANENGGVSDIFAETLSPVIAYYTLQGQHVTNPTAGLYLVRRADGTTGKILVK